MNTRKFLMLIQAIALTACATARKPASLNAAGSKQIPNIVLEDGITIRDTLSDMTLFILSDVPESDYFYMGKPVGYYDLGKHAGEKQFCIYRPQGLTKSGLFSKVSDVRSEKIFTPTGSFQGLTFVLENGGSIRAAGSLESSANGVLYSCLGPLAQLRTDTSAPEPKEFQESENLTEQLRAFTPRALKAMNETTCEQGVGRGENAKKMFDDFQTVVNVLETALRNNPKDGSELDRMFKAGVRAAALSQEVGGVSCIDLNYRTPTNCDVNMGVGGTFQKKERAGQDRFWMQFTITLKGQNIIHNAYARYVLKQPEAPGREDEVTYGLGIQPKSEELYLLKRIEEGQATISYRNRFSIIERRWGTLQAFVVTEKSTSKNSQLPPYCGPNVQAP